jgi:ubiquitin carboxyl-terminal hydrolase L5
MSGSTDDDWCTIESDPGVFTNLLETIGCTTVELQELWSLDDDALVQLQNSTNTVYGLIFLFQWIGAQQAEHAESSEPLAEEDIPDDLFFAHQITTNACATQAILSVVLNAKSLATTTTSTSSSTTTPEGGLGETLSEFMSFTKEFPPNLAGVAISSSEVIKRAHNSFARQDGFLNQDKKKMRVVASDEDEAFHFVAYVPVNGIVYELDGLQKGPIVAGAYDDDNESASPSSKPSDWLVQAVRSHPSSRVYFIRNIYPTFSLVLTSLYPFFFSQRNAIQARMASGEHVKFNLMAVIQDKRIALRNRLAAAHAEFDDHEAAAQLAAEESKRQEWKNENQRRRHNFVPLCVQILKELAAAGRLSQLAVDAREKQAQKRQNQSKE